MFSISIIAEESEAIAKLRVALAQRGFACSVASNDGEVASRISEQDPDLVLVANNGYQAKIRGLCQRLKQERHLPIITLASRETLHSINVDPNLDDFIVEPYDLSELVLRIERLLQKNSPRDSIELIKYGDLVIDLARCEVSVADRRVVLTFKEYQLLKFLASNRGRVFTREALLNKVWGYDYYGGDRTVDVHIRRLRSKIEGSSHTFIETVRNIGYKFKENM